MIYRVKYLFSAKVVAKNKVMIFFVQVREKDSRDCCGKMSKGFTHYGYFT